MQLNRIDVVVLISVYVVGYIRSWGPMTWLVPIKVFPLEIPTAEHHNGIWFRIFNGHQFRQSSCVIFLQNNVPCILWKWACRPSIVGYGSYYRRSKARPSSITSFMTSSPMNYTTRGGSNNGTWIILFVVEVLEMKHFLQARLLQKNRTSLVIATWLCLLFEGIQSLLSPLLGDWSDLRMIWRQRGHLPFLWLCKRGNIDNDMYDNMMKRCYDAKCIMSNVLWWRCIKI